MYPMPMFSNFILVSKLIIVQHAAFVFFLHLNVVFNLMVYSPSFTPLFFQEIIHPLVHFPVRHALIH